MTKNQLNDWFSPAATWALPGNPARTAALLVVQKIIARTAVELPGVAQRPTPAVPANLIELRVRMGEIDGRPVADFRLRWPLSIRAVCAKVLRTAFGPDGNNVVAALVRPIPFV